MRTSTLWQGFLAASVSLALAAPAVVYGQSSGHRDSYHNFASDQVFT